MELKLIDGRNFQPGDQNAIIVNEALYSQLSKDQIGGYFNWGGSDSSKIIGVVKNFHFRSLETPVEPLFLTTSYSKAGFLTSLIVRIKNTNITNTVEKFKHIWKEVNPGKPFEGYFLDVDLQRQYASYQQWTTLLTFAMYCGCIISCIGVFALTGIYSINRYREMAVRRVFGAGRFEILFLLNKRYLSLVLASTCIAIPLAFYILNEWLQNFVYKAELGLGVVILPVVVGGIIVIVSVSYYSVKLLRANPVESMRES
jgi:putative ABC transport system permease protein